LMLVVTKPTCHARGQIVNDGTVHAGSGCIFPAREWSNTPRTAHRYISISAENSRDLSYSNARRANCGVFAHLRTSRTI
jgi:hypothetical protein